jgi:hypothetical protein
MSPFALSLTPFALSLSKGGRLSPVFQCDSTI